MLPPAWEGVLFAGSQPRYRGLEQLGSHEVVREQNMLLSQQGSLYAQNLPGGRTQTHHMRTLCAQTQVWLIVVLGFLGGSCFLMELVSWKKKNPQNKTQQTPNLPLPHSDTVGPE